MSTSETSVSPAAAGPSGFLSLPAPAQALLQLGPPRGASVAEAGLARIGSAFQDALPQNHVSRSANRAVFAPQYGGAQRSPADLAYCVYVFETTGFDRDLTLRFDWLAPPPAGSLFAGLANFAAGRWEWHQLEGSVLNLPGLADYQAADGRLLCAVLCASTSEATLSGLRLGTAPPVAVLDQSDDFGGKPFLVTFDISASHDPDGEIVQYELDFEGDGIADFTLTSPPGAPIEHTYTAPGVFYPLLRVTDDTGVTGSAEGRVVSNQNTPPYPQLKLTVAPLAGEVPVLVVFDASATTDDGTQLDYAFDFDGDGHFDVHGDDPVVMHTYVNGGEFEAKLGVVDEWGNSTWTTKTLTFTDPANQPPSAALSATPVSTSFPVTYRLDAGDSTDADGSVVWYDWDFDGDGTYDASGPQPAVEHAYYAQGSPLPAVRVHDNDAALAIAAAPAPLSIAAGWETASVPGFASGEQTSLALVNPAGGDPLVTLAATALTGTPVQLTSVSLADLDHWPGPSAVSSQNCGGALDVLDVGGRPAVLYQRSGAGGGLSYVQAIDSGGTSWQSPVAVTSSGQTQAIYIEGTLVEGQPAAAFAAGGGDIRYCRALDADGTVWGAVHTPITIPMTLSCLGLAMGFANGKPALAAVGSTFGGLELRFVQAQDSAGSAWPAASGLVDGSTGVSEMRCFGFDTIGTRPALVYSDGFGDLVLRRASTDDGASWGPRLKLTDYERDGQSDKSFARLVNWNGLPTVSYYDRVVDDLVLIRAQTPDAAAWDLPQHLATAGDQGWGADALVLDGVTLLLSYWDKTAGELKVAWFTEE